MTARVSAAVPINDPTSPYRPHAKVAHRGDPRVVVRHGAHGAYSRRFRPLPDWPIAEVFHFPFRSLEQWERKGVRRARADKPLGQYVRALHAHELGRARERYRSLVVDDAVLARGIASGSLAIDTRLRDALRPLREAGLRTSVHRLGEASEAFAEDGVAPAVDAGLIAERAGLQEADVVRLFRHLDGLDVRIDRLRLKRRRGRR